MIAMKIGKYREVGVINGWGVLMIVVSQIFGFLQASLWAFSVERKLIDRFAPH